MAAVAMSGADSFSLNNTILADLADGDCVTVEFPNEIMQVKKGKNGNTIYGFNAQGQIADVKIRLVRGSADDQFLNSLITQQNANPAGFVLMIGEFIKILGDGAGNITNDIYVFAGGVFTKQVMGKSNVEGDATQSVSEYTIRFSSAPRAIT